MTEVAAGNNDKAIAESSFDVADQIVAETMAEDLDVSLEVARELTVEQNDFASLSEDLAVVLGEEFWGGSAIDVAGDSSLRIFVDEAAPDVLQQQVVERMGGFRAELVEVPYGLADLEQFRLVVEELLASVDGFAGAYIDVGANALELRFESVLSAEQRSVVESSLTAANVGAEIPFIITDDVGADVEAGCSSSLMICDLPLRGGVEIYDGNPSGGYYLCTGGFVTKASNGKRYLLTAGHCAAEPDQSWWISANASATNYSIGVPHQRPGWSQPWLWNSYHDLAMINAGPNYAGGTIYDTGVLVHHSGGTYPTTYDSWYDITAVGYASTVPQNYYLCYSAAFSKTECSQYQSYSGNFVLMKIPDVGATICLGDSGGPVFRSGKAYGMISSVKPPVYPVQKNSHFTGTVTTECVGSSGGWKFYSISAALNASSTSIMP